MPPDSSWALFERAKADAVRDHVATCPDAHREIAELAAGIPALWDDLAPVAPAPALRGRVLAAAAADLAGAAAVDRPAAGGPAADVDTPAALVTGAVGVDVAVSALPGGAAGSPGPASAAVVDLAERRERRRTRVIRGLIAVAAAIAIVVLGAWNWPLQGQVRDLTAYQQRVGAVIQAAAAPGAHLVVLAAATPGGPSGLAAVASDGSLTLAMHDLAPTTGSSVYTAWVIPPGAAPSNIGSFAVGGDGFGSLATAGPAGSGFTLGLTLEPAPGATTPTLPIIASGSVPANG